MNSLPALENLFPENTAFSRFCFWVTYWCVFFVLLPWMLLRQLWISCQQVVSVLRLWQREIELIPGVLTLVFLNNLPSLPVTLVFGERFTLIRFRDVLIDPGPVFAAVQIQPLLDRLAGKIEAVLVTHAHEEHIGNSALAAAKLQVPIYGSAETLAALREPEALSLARRTFIGQPQAALDAELRLLGTELRTSGSRFEIISSPGHCDGHASFYAPEQGILFAGDSFMHLVFTSPNADVSGSEWIATLRDYCRLEIKTLIGTHGLIYSLDPQIPVLPGIVSRQDPMQLIRDKLAFLEWASRAVSEGERRGLPYPVIEACLFPWRQWWSWSNWFTDESGRLFSAGEFSRTHFIRSLSVCPERVPERFPLFARLRRVGKQFLRLQSRP